MAVLEEEAVVRGKEMAALGASSSEQQEEMEKVCESLREEKRKMEEELAKVRRDLRDERGRRVRAEAELVRIRAKAEGIDISDINIEGNLSSYDEETDEWTDEETEDNDISEGEEGGGRRLKSPTPRSPGRGVLKRKVRRGGGGERGGNLYYELKG